MVLGSNVTFSSQHVRARNIVAAVTKLHLQGTCARCSREELVAKADTEDWGAVLLNGGFDVVDGFSHHSWITWAVGDEETIVVLSSKGGEVVVPWAYKDLNTTPDEAPQLVVLESDIQAQYSDWAAGWVDESIGRLGRV